MDTTGFLARGTASVSWHDLLWGMVPGAIIVLCGVGYLGWMEWRARRARRAALTPGDIAQVDALLDAVAKPKPAP